MWAKPWLLAALFAGAALTLLYSGQVSRAGRISPRSSRLQLYEGMAGSLHVADALGLYREAISAAHQFAFAYKQRRPTVQMLFISTRHHYLNNMDRFLYKVIDAAVEHPTVNATVWGPGWADYNANVSLTDNIRQRFGCAFDVTFAKLGAFTGGLRDGVFLMEEWEAYEPCEQEVIVEELADCHNLACTQHKSFDSAHVISSRFAFVPIELFYPMPGLPKLFVHIPDCANPAMAMPLPWSERATNATLVGHTWEKLYPLRPKIQAAVSQGLIHGGIEHEHPGYSVVQAPVDPPLDYEVQAASVQPMQKQFEAYFRSLQTSKICMFDSSIVRKGIAKYFEALMAGCVVAADLPLELEEVLSEAMILLQASDSPQTIADKVNAALADPAGLQRKAARGAQIARQHFTCEHKLERILDAAEEYRAGVRGYHFPFGFRIGCHSYFPSDNRPAHPWCSSPSGPASVLAR